MSKGDKSPSAVVAWSVAAVIFCGFAIGGSGMIVGWPVFWAGVAVVAVGLVAGWVTHVMEYTEEYDLNSPDRTEPGTTTWHG